MKNLPNILTVSRIFITFFFIYYLFVPGFSAKLIAAFIFLFASLTDLFDGYYARKHNFISTFGKIMDPIADKFLVLSAFYCFAHLQIIPWWMFIVVAVREVFITILRLFAMRGGKVLAAEMAGKVKTILQMVTNLVILIFLVGKESFLQGNQNAEIIYLKAIMVLMLVIVGLTLYSGVMFLWNNRKINYFSS